LHTILDDQDWEEYRDKWKPTWQLRNTKVLVANIHLIPERQVYPKGSKWIHDMIYKKTKRDALYAEDALQREFHDILGIWCHGRVHNGIYEKYFCIHRTRDLTWPMPTQNSVLWPRGDPKLIFPDTVYDFSAYK